MGTSKENIHENTCEDSDLMTILSMNEVVLLFNDDERGAKNKESD